MGMDIYGRTPVDETGEYFRRTIWGWLLIPAYLKDQHPDFIALIAAPIDPDTGLLYESNPDIDVAVFWSSNDGHGLLADEAAALADALDTDVASGAAEAWIHDFHIALLKLPRTTCDICNGTGIRTDRIGVNDGMTTQVVDGPDGNPRMGQTGSCNGCDGWGAKMSFLANYDLEPDDLTEFAAVMRTSGGLEIW